MRKKIILFLIIFFFGFISGILLLYFITLQPKNKDNISKNPIINKNYGEEIKILETKVNKRNITINTEYLGSGSSEIIIDDSLNPRANDWNKKRIIISAGLSTDKMIIAGCGYRINSFMLNALPFIRFRDYGKIDNVGIMLIGSYMF